MLNTGSRGKVARERKPVISDDNDDDVGKGKVKVKLSQCLPKLHAMKTC
jgi:hypothetical protein